MSLCLVPPGREVLPSRGLKHRLQYLQKALRVASRYPQTHVFTTRLPVHNIHVRISMTRLCNVLPAVMRLEPALNPCVDLRVREVARAPFLSEDIPIFC